MTMQGETGEITLAGKKVAISALSLDQLQAVLPALDRMRVAKDDIVTLMAAARTVVAASTGIPDEELGKMTISLPELMAGVSTVCRIAGLDDLGKKNAATES